VIPTKSRVGKPCVMRHAGLAFCLLPVLVQTEVFHGVGVVQILHPWIRELVRVRLNIASTLL
jgi:hypothetical protein